MAHQLDTDLVVADTAKTIHVSLGKEVIVVPRAASTRECKEALFGEQGVEFKLAKLEIEPGRVQQVIEAHPGIFKVEARAFGHGRQHRERDVFVEGAGGPDVEAGEIKAVRCDGLLS